MNKKRYIKFNIYSKPDDEKFKCEANARQISVAYLGNIMINIANLLHDHDSDFITAFAIQTIEQNFLGKEKVNDQKIFIREKRKFLTIVVKTGGTTTVFSAIDRAIVNKEDNSLTLINYYGSRRVVAEHIHLEMYDWVTFYDTDCLSIPRMGFKVPSKRN